MAGKPDRSGRPRRRSGYEEAKAMGVDPFRYLAERFASFDPGTEKDDLAKELLPYVVPKLKAVEIDFNGHQSITIQIGSSSGEQTQLGEITELGDEGEDGD